MLYTWKNLKAQSRCLARDLLILIAHQGVLSQHRGHKGQYTSAEGVKMETWITVFCVFFFPFTTKPEKFCLGSTFRPPSTDDIMESHASVTTSEARQNHGTSSREVSDVYYFKHIIDSNSSLIAQ